MTLNSRRPGLRGKSDQQLLSNQEERHSRRFPAAKQAIPNPRPRLLAGLLYLILPESNRDAAIEHLQKKFPKWIKNYGAIAYLIYFQAVCVRAWPRIRKLLGGAIGLAMWEWIRRHWL